MAGKIKAGFGISDITPQVGVELSGFGWCLGRKCTGVLEPIYARAMMWADSGTRGILVSCDLIGFTIKLKEKIRMKLSSEFNIKDDHILICATHTHSGPASGGLIGWGEEDEAYLNDLPERIASAVAEAEHKLVDASFEYSEVEVEGISYNRENRQGDTDKLLKLLKVKGERGVTGYISNYSCHPVVMCEETSLVCGDFVGMAVNKINKKYGINGMFLQGSCGDQNSIYCHKPQDESIQNLQILSDRFSQYIDSALNASKPVTVDRIASVMEKITLPQTEIPQSDVIRTLDIVNHCFKYIESLPEDLKKRIMFEKAAFEALMARCGRMEDKGLSIEIQAVCFGDILLLAQPSELFYCFHKEIEKKFSPQKVLISGYANGYIGYIPSSECYDISKNGYSYPAHFVPLLLGEFPFREDAGRILADALVRLGNQILT